jgi:hypothetical protein
MSRRVAIIVLTFYAGLVAIAAATRAGAFAAVIHIGGHTRVTGHGQIRFDGAGPELWAFRFRRERRVVMTLRRELAGYRLRPRPPVLPAWWRADAMCVHQHESLDWHNRGYFRGGMQFLPSTWASVGGQGDAADASVSEQLYRSYLLWKSQGWSPWPNSSRACGLR